MVPGVQLVEPRVPAEEALLASFVGVLLHVLRTSQVSYLISVQVKSRSSDICTNGVNMKCPDSLSRGARVCEEGRCCLWTAGWIWPSAAGG